MTGHTLCVWHFGPEYLTPAVTSFYSTGAAVRNGCRKKKPGAQILMNPRQTPRTEVSQTGLAFKLTDR